MNPNRASILFLIFFVFGLLDHVKNTYCGDDSNRSFKGGPSSLCAGSLRASSTAKIPETVNGNLISAETQSRIASAEGITAAENILSLKRPLDFSATKLIQSALASEQSNAPISDWESQLIHRVVYPKLKQSGLIQQTKYDETLAEENTFTANERFRAQSMALLDQARRLASEGNGDAKTAIDEYESIRSGVEKEISRLSPEMFSAAYSRNLEALSKLQKLIYAKFAFSLLPSEIRDKKGVSIIESLSRLGEKTGWIAECIFDWWGLTTSASTTIPSQIRELYLRTRNLNEARTLSEHLSDIAVLETAMSSDKTPIVFKRNILLMLLRQFRNVKDIRWSIKSVSNKKSIKKAKDSNDGESERWKEDNSQNTLLLSQRLQFQRSVARVIRSTLLSISIIAKCRADVGVDSPLPNTFISSLADTEKNAAALEGEMFRVFELEYKSRIQNPE